MVTIEEVLKEVNPVFGIKAPSKPKPLKFNIFYYHRRYPTHKFLPSNSSIWDKCKNGDFEYSPYAKHINYEYWWMAEEIANVRNSNSNRDVKEEKERDIRANYNKRIKNLRQDFQRDELERMKNLKNSLRLSFGGTMEEVSDFIENFACGTTDEIIRSYRTIRAKLTEDTLPF